MGFKLLFKQSFKNLKSKFRLYLSLIIFLVVGFSIINGISTFINNFENNFKTILYKGHIQNYQIENKQFEDYKINKHNKNIMFRMTEKSHNDFVNFLAKEMNKVDSSLNIESYAKNLNDDDIVNQVGKYSGDLNLVGFGSVNNDHFDKDKELLKKVSKYYSNNLMQMFLSEFVLKNQDNENAYLGYLSGEDYDKEGYSLLVKPIPLEKNGSNLLNPYIKNGLNEINFLDKENKKFKYKKEFKDLTAFYVSPDYLRHTKKKIGSKINVNVNNKLVKGYIKGLANDKTKIIYEPHQSGVYVDLNTFEDITDGKFLNQDFMEGYLKIEDSKNSFENKGEVEIAAKRINRLILKTNNYNYEQNVKEPIFEKTIENLNVDYVSPVDYYKTALGGYHQPLNIYGGFTIFIASSLSILIIIVSLFIIDESIRSEKKTLWFLKSMGEKNIILSLINSLSVFVPLITAIALSIPGMMLMMSFLQTAIMDTYAFNVNFYDLSILSLIIMLAFLFGTLFIFLIINIIMISGKGLSQETNNNMSKFQIILAKVTNPFTKNANAKFRVGFAFVRQNFIKNVVSFVLFGILFTVTLFGVQFNKSIDVQKNSYQKWFGEYQSISMLSPKRMITYDDNAQTTYKTLSYDELVKLRQDDSEKDEFAKKYNYDLIAFIKEEILNRVKYLKIDIDKKVVTKIPSSDIEMFQLSSQLISNFENIKQEKDVNSKIVDTVKETHPNKILKDASLGQWKLRQIRNISLWNVDYSYIESTLKLFEKESDENKDKVIKQYNEVIKNISPSLIPMFNSINQLVNSQKDIFGIQYPSFNMNFGNIIKPKDSIYKSAYGLELNKENKIFNAYGIDSNDQPFIEPIEGLNKNIGTIRGKDGVLYNTIDIKLSTVAKDRYLMEENDLIPIKLNELGLEENELPLAFKISGFVKNDSVILEGFFNKEAMYEVIRQNNINIENGSLDNTFFTNDKIPYFVRNISVPHLVSSGDYIDDYIYEMDTFISDHKTTSQVTAAFAQTVDEYIKLMTKIIILLIILCVALSSIMITLILFENKKTILLFKAMGYKKREVIWYLISGYLIAVTLAFILSIGLTVGLVRLLAPVAASSIFLILEFNPFWLFFLIGIFETIGFMILVIVSVATYARVLKPRDAFSTL